MNLGFLKVQKPKPAITDPEKIKKLYKTWRVRVMYTTFIGYALYYFCRKNLSAATPGMIADLGYTKTQIGSLWSILYLTYGFAKFGNGILADRANPRYFMAIGLFLSAIVNIFFGLSTSLYALAFWWGVNGWVQGMGWPPCARLLTYWYSTSERGTTWGIWNASHQVGGAIILVLGGYLTEHYGWRSAFLIPSIFAILGAFFLVNRLRDTPESMGLPSVEDYRNDHGSAANEEKIDETHAVKDIVLKNVLGNKQIWFLAFAYFFVYLVRYGAMDWAPTFLVEVKHSSISKAAMKTAWFEILGIFGALAAGWLSDTYFKGRRTPLNMLYMFVLAFAVGELWLIPPGHETLDSLALAAIGFLVYGPQMMVSLCAADKVSKNAAGTATGFVGLFGYMGSIASGIGTGWIVDHYGWNGGFIFFVASAIIGGLLLIPTWSDDKKVSRAKRA